MLSGSNPISVPGKACNLNRCALSRKNQNYAHLTRGIPNHIGFFPCATTFSNFDMAAPSSSSSLAQRFFIVHREDFENELNLNVLIPKLNAMEMLVLGEMELLTLPQSSSQTKIQQFVQIMCRKGEKAPDLFLRCLRSAADHLPHSDLADKMERWLREHSESPDTPGHVPSTCSCPYTYTSQQPTPLLTDSKQSDPRQVAPPTVANTDSQHLTTLPGSTMNINIHIHNSLSQSHSNQEVTPEVFLANPSLTQNPATPEQPIPKQQHWPVTLPPIIALPTETVSAISRLAAPVSKETLVSGICSKEELAYNPNGIPIVEDSTVSKGEYL